MITLRHFVLLVAFILWIAGTVTFAQDQSAQVVRGVAAKYGNGLVTGAVADSISEGTLTFFTMRGQGTTFDVTVYSKGKNQVQRIIKEPAAWVLEGTNGVKTWSSLMGHSTTEAKGPALKFIESQTVRSVAALLDQSAKFSLKDLGSKGNARTIEATDPSGRKTSYFVDGPTSTVTRIEFVTGQAVNAFNNKIVPNIEAYVFSDFRTVQGTLTPFKIERYFNGIKTEETQFTTVKYNASVPDSVFRP